MSVAHDLSFLIIQSAAVKRCLVKVRRIQREFLLAPVFPALVLLASFLHILLWLYSLCPAVVLLSHPDYCLPSCMAVLQLLKSLRHLAKWKVGLHNWQDLWQKAEKYQQCHLNESVCQDTIKFIKFIFNALLFLTSSHWPGPSHFPPSRSHLWLFVTQLNLLQFSWSRLHLQCPDFSWWWKSLFYFVGSG